MNNLKIKFFILDKLEKINMNVKDMSLNDEEVLMLNKNIFKNILDTISAYPDFKNKNRFICNELKERTLYFINQNNISEFDSYLLEL